jgi:DNA-binding transcriptional LysR family regulator
VRFGVTWGLWEAVNRILSHQAATMPGVAVLGDDIPSPAQPDALRQRRIDVGLARPPLDSRELRRETLFDESVVVVLPAGHALAKSRALRLADLADERLLLHDRDLAPSIYDKILELYGAAGISPHIVQTTASPASPAGMIQVASGKGIFIGLGSLLAYREAPGLGVVLLDEPRASLPVCAVWRAAESSPVVLQFVQTIRDAFQGAVLPTSADRLDKDRFDVHRAMAPAAVAAVDRGWDLGLESWEFEIW